MIGSTVKNISTRPQFLTIIGLAQAGMGATYADPALLTVPRALAFQWVPADWFSPVTMGVVMLVSGILCLFAVATSGIQTRWSSRIEKAAFGIATIPYSLLTLVFLGSGLMGGYHFGFFSAISYASLTAFVLMAAGTAQVPSDSTGSVPVPPSKEKLNE